MRRLLATSFVSLILFVGVSVSAGGAHAAQDPSGAIGTLEQARTPVQQEERNPWREAIIALPVAAALGAVLAFRPVRRGTPPRDAAVIQTQIVLAIVGAVIMLVVGASLARAFGIVGAASLVRYRAKIDDPKDAAVMLVALSIGLASGVGIYGVAAICTVFILVVLWGLESFEPAPKKEFLLKVQRKDVDDLRDGIEQALRQHKVRYELRAAGPDEMSYHAILPIRKRTDAVSNSILKLSPDDEPTVEWETPKKK